jgi:hypothetical protein
MAYQLLKTKSALYEQGRPLRVTRMTPAEARQEALYLLRQGRVAEGTKIRATIQLLSTAGVLPSDTIADLVGVSERTMRRYRKTQLLDRIAVPERLNAIYPADTIVYALGPIGQMVGEILYDLIPIGYIEAKQDRVSHDLLCNLVMDAVSKGVRSLGYRAEWYSKYEATLHDRDGRPLIEPDAMVLVTHATKRPQTLLIEYHHEHYSRRGESKVMKYERILRENKSEWQTKWQTQEAPTILVVWKHNAVGNGYHKHLEERRMEEMSIQGRWLGKPLQAFLEKQTVLLWDNMGTGQSQDRLLRL